MNNDKIEVENIDIKENHKIIMEILPNLCGILNKHEIDYYLIGAIPAILLINGKLSRYHDDIDILINENDIDKLKLVLSNKDYILEDKTHDKNKIWQEQKNKPKGGHEWEATYTKYKFKIGFFLFKREIDNSITTRTYFTKDNVFAVEENYSTIETTKLRYPEKFETFNNFKFRTCCFELLYNVKNFLTRPKDICDKSIIEPHINKNIAFELEEEYKQKKRIVVV
ncbi:MAG TPA: hypothetical protein DEP72_05805 [Clostridiales bacterium]|nr:MAG: hypothetical protein A2Y18_06280 [Clostridiales bacterium GWD2_32_19]HCC07656.1 hypothetical protein [Clostridiales bacterium]